MKTIDWNQASQLGLIARINHEILHPLGLAMTRNPDTGASESLLVADDGIWVYSDTILKKPIMNVSKIKEKIAQFVGEQE